MTMPPDAGPRQYAQDQRNAPQGPQPITEAADAALKLYDDTYTNARKVRLDAGQSVIQAQQAVNDLQDRLKTAGPVEAETINAALGDAQTRLSRAEQTYNQALANESRAADQRNDAYAKAVQQGDPQAREAARAQLEIVKAEAARAKQELDEWAQSAPERKAALAAQQRLSGLQAQQAQLDLDFQRETDPIRRQALQQQLSQNQLDLDTARQIAPTTVARAQQEVKAGEQALTSGEIGIQTQQAQLDDLLRRIRQAPSDEQARAALEQALAQGQANLEATQTGTARQKALLPGELAQQQADLDMPKQGTLYGLDDYIAQQKEAIARGAITTDQANQALQARIAGTDVYTASQAADAALRARTGEEITQRGQDVSLAGQRVGTLGSMATAGLNQFSALNQYVSPGSDAAGRGLLGWLTGAEQMVNRQGAPPPRVQSAPLPSFLQGFAGGQQQPGPTGAGQVVINIGAPPQAQYGVGAAQQPNSPSNNFQTNEPGVRNSIVPQQQAPAMLDRFRPATPADVERVWGRGGTGTTYGVR